ncbi:hypothetical protein GCM10010303_29920 [Streptomyces purpurascens]|nr:hypothetical protein GCM10010303_29920 [Streptomyces purpurascens]
MDIVIELPAGSRVEAEAAWADFRAGGRTGRRGPDVVPGRTPAVPTVHGRPRTPPALVRRA